MEGKSEAPCRGLTDLFFGPSIDSRSEKYRAAREAHAKEICLDHCEIRLTCLEFAMVLHEEHGVWGGMGESERHRFRTHLDGEGYTGGAVPEGAEFWSALYHFYNAEASARNARLG